MMKSTCAYKKMFMLKIKISLSLIEQGFAILKKNQLFSKTHLVSSTICVVPRLQVYCLVFSRYMINIYKA